MVIYVISDDINIQYSSIINIEYSAAGQCDRDFPVFLCYTSYEVIIIIVVIFLELEN